MHNNRFLPVFGQWKNVTQFLTVIFGDPIFGHFGPSDFLQFGPKTDFFVRTDLTKNSKIFHHAPILTEIDQNWQKWTFVENWREKFQIWGPHFWSFWPLRFSSIWPENGLFREVGPYEKFENFSPWPHFDRNWPKLTEMDFCRKLAKKVPNLGTPFLVILAPQICLNLAWKRTFSWGRSLRKIRKFFTMAPFWPKLTKIDRNGLL